MLGTGCVYPSRVQTLVDELAAAHDSWKAYVEGIDTTPRPPGVAASEARRERWDHVPRAEDPYVTWSNPFVYFTSLTSGTACQENDVGLNTLPADLKTASKAPSVHTSSRTRATTAAMCRVRRRRPRVWPSRQVPPPTVTEIENSSPYKDHGLIAITFDEAAQSGPHADPSACCNTPAYPNMPADTAANTSTISPASDADGHPHVQRDDHNNLDDCRDDDGIGHDGDARRDDDHRFDHDRHAPTAQPARPRRPAAAGRSACC